MIRHPITPGWTVIGCRIDYCPATTLYLRLSCTVAYTPTAGCRIDCRDAMHRVSTWPQYQHPELFTVRQQPCIPTFPAQ
ncbi:MAG: hypothetical protein LBL07_16815 [Tannerella sp.]|nr:hypothetical protein [Tannerella sp.]